MNWAVEIQRSAEKELAGLATTMQERIARALLALEANPFPPGVKKRKAARLDRFMGVADGRFFLSHGGFVPGSTRYGEKFTRPAKGKPRRLCCRKSRRNERLQPDDASANGARAARPRETKASGGRGRCAVDER